MVRCLLGYLLSHRHQDRIGIHCENASVGIVLEGTQGQRAWSATQVQDLCLRRTRQIGPLQHKVEAVESLWDVAVLHGFPPFEPGMPIQIRITKDHSWQLN